MNLRPRIRISPCVEAILFLALGASATGCGRSEDPKPATPSTTTVQTQSAGQPSQPAGDSPRGNPSGVAQLPPTVTLARRTEPAEYTDSAYSFLHMSQDVNVHRNTVDLVYEGCGAIHLSSPGRANRIADLGESNLADVTAVPDQAWKETSTLGYITPRSEHVYVLHVIDINDNKTPFYVKFRVAKVSDDAVDLECAFLNEDSASKFRAIQFTRRELMRSLSGVSSRCSFDHES